MGSTVTAIQFWSNRLTSYIKFENWSIFQTYFTWKYSPSHLFLFIFNYICRSRYVVGLLLIIWGILILWWNHFNQKNLQYMQCKYFSIRTIWYMICIYELVGFDIHWYVCDRYYCMRHCRTANPIGVYAITT